LRHAIDCTFTARNTQIIPQFVPAPPASWVTPYRRLAIEIGLNPDMAVGHRSSADFLDPILNGNAPVAARWDPSEGAWKSLDDTASSG
jgi:hypothetical protein